MRHHQPRPIQTAGRDTSDLFSATYERLRAESAGESCKRAIHEGWASSAYTWACQAAHAARKVLAMEYSS